MNTAVETRDVLSKVDGVIRVHPNGLNGKALVFVKDKKVFSPDAAKTALATTKDLRMRKCEVTKV
jgi:hypothetical protein